MSVSNAKQCSVQKACMHACVHGIFVLYLIRSLGRGIVVYAGLGVQ